MSQAPVIGIVMGEPSDWQVLEHAANRLQEFGVSWESRVLSPYAGFDHLRAEIANVRERGLKCLMVGSSSSAQLAGMIASMAQVPVLAVPLDSPALKGVDVLKATLHLPERLPVATFAIGRAGAVNAALFAIAMLANEDPVLAEKLAKFRKAQSDHVKAITLPPLD